MNSFFLLMRPELLNMCFYSLFHSFLIFEALEFFSWNNIHNKS